MSKKDKNIEDLLISAEEKKDKLENDNTFNAC